MQLPSLLTYGPATPMDEDPFTVETKNWLATTPGDTLVGAVPLVYLVTGFTSLGYPITGPQSDVTVVAVSIDPVSLTKATVWLTGGVIGSTYLVTWHLTTADGRSDYKSVLLPITSARS